MKKTRVDYVYADPAGNITLLVETPCPADAYPQIAAKLLAAEPDAEQVGFVESVSPQGVTLHMAGGEFCGNAAFSGAALAAWKAGTDEGLFSVDFFGLDRPLSASVKRIAENRFSGEIEIPSPEELSQRELRFRDTVLRLPVVRFPGIAHILCPVPLDASFAESSLKQWCAELEAPAAGIMLLDEERMSLVPLVYVPAADTLFWERSCASGTCAAAAWLSSRSGMHGVFRFSEPGGTLGAETGPGSLKLLDSVELSFRSVLI